MYHITEKQDGTTDVYEPQEDERFCLDSWFNQLVTGDGWTRALRTRNGAIEKCTVYLHLEPLETWCPHFREWLEVEREADTDSDEHESNAIDWYDYADERRDDLKARMGGLR